MGGFSTRESPDLTTHYVTETTSLHGHLLFRTKRAFACVSGAAGAPGPAAAGAPAPGARAAASVAARSFATAAGGGSLACGGAGHGAPAAEKLFTTGRYGAIPSAAAGWSAAAGSAGAAACCPRSLNGSRSAAGAALGSHCGCGR